MKLSELRKIVKDINQSDELTVFVRDGCYVVRREGTTRHVMREAERLAQSLSFKGVNGIPQVYNGQRHFYAVNYAEVIIPREQV